MTSPSQHCMGCWETLPPQSCVRQMPVLSSPFHGGAGTHERQKSNHPCLQRMLLSSWYTRKVQDPLTFGFWNYRGWIHLPHLFPLHGQGIFITKFSLISQVDQWEELQEWACLKWLLLKGPLPLPLVKKNKNFWNQRDLHGGGHNFGSRIY